MIERRSYHRFPVKGSLTLHPDTEPTKALKGNLNDIGFLGFSGHLKESIETGVLVQFELITSLMRTPLTGRGKIMYIKEKKEDDIPNFRVGVGFIDVDKNIISRLLNMIQYEINVEMAKKRKTR